MNNNIKVLTLNKVYQPLSIVSLYDALKAVINERAEVITVKEGSYLSHNIDEWFELSVLKSYFEEELTGREDWIKTPGMNIEAPRIIRFLNFDKKPFQKVKFSRKNIFLRDNFVCQYCGNKFPIEKLQLEHVVPRSKGGKTTWLNTVCSCHKCNTRKRNRTPQEAGMSLIRKPFKPVFSFTSSLKIPHNAKEKYTEWQHFLDEMYWNKQLDQD